VPENRSALAAVQRVAACLGSRRSQRLVNPLFLHGPPGSGKTALVTALVQELMREAPHIVVTTLRAGELERRSIQADDGEPVDENPLEAVRDSDLVVIEDLQTLTERSAGAFARALDDMQAREIQMVLTSSVGPRHLALPGRLTSRLLCGLVVGVAQFGRDSRLVFLRDRSQRRQLAVQEQVLAWLADHLPGSGRQLEGALARVDALLRMLPGPMLLDTETLAEHFKADLAGSRQSVERIAERVGNHFRVEPKQLCSKRRSRDVLLPRQVGMYLARRLTALSLEQIGAYFGGRDHTTVLHACRKVERALNDDTALSGTVRELQAGLA
jgi:chromosomal replication initiator protein